MKRKLIFICILIISLACAFVVINKLVQKKDVADAPSDVGKNSSENPVEVQVKENAPGGVNTLPSQEVKNDFVFPLERLLEREQKKTFGMLITKNNLPVQPERFSGFHTGVDFEIFPEEKDAAVPVFAVCSGKLAQKRTASGYGGVAVQACEIEGKPVTVVYGHLKLSSIKYSSGDEIVAGEEVGILGAGGSVETDGERKHLHLGIHRGTSVNILGYVQNSNELPSWIDPCLYVCRSDGGIKK